MLEKLKIQKKNLRDIKSALEVADKDGDNMVNFDEWREELRARGHDDDEIEAVFDKFDLDGDRILDKDELAVI